MSDPIVLGQGLNQEESDAYKKKIANLKGVDSIKGSTAVGGIPRPAMPQVAPTQQESVLSQQVARQLTKAATAVEKADKAEEQKEVPQSAIDNLLEEFDFSSTQEAERVLNNRERRKKIEARCEPIDVKSLIMRDYVEQKVPIKPGVFEVVYRTYTPKESMFIKQYLGKHRSVNDLHYLETYSLCQLTCCVVSINGTALPSHLDANTGDPRDDLFEAKMALITKKNSQVIADLAINFLWFDIRVRKSLTEDTVGPF